MTFSRGWHTDAVTLLSLSQRKAWQPMRPKKVSSTFPIGSQRISVPPSQPCSSSPTGRIQAERNLISGKQQLILRGPTIKNVILRTCTALWWFSMFRTGLLDGENSFLVAPCSFYISSNCRSKFDEQLRTLSRAISDTLSDILKDKESRKSLYSQRIWCHLFFDLVGNFQKSSNPSEVTICVGDILVQYLLPEKGYAKQCASFFRSIQTGMEEEKEQRKESFLEARYQSLAFLGALFEFQALWFTKMIGQKDPDLKVTPFFQTQNIVRL